MLKIIYTLALVALTSITGLHASTLKADLAKNQEVLSQKMVLAYAQRKDIARVIDRLEEQQNRLKDSIHDPEISNLLDFLQLCLRNVKTISIQPPTDKNKQEIADLGSSISEGSRYIARTLQ